ncbi:NYN domain-containing protein [Clostridium chromiireducens]|uniref:NYN domain-containing protein n=1 Tax=Clostridium chromiireducens TaxID=225345 RepID=A0A964W500_9CLOT|nr:NYN domain-containing protein [Clostridium chromiireducens]MVX67056.1 NYN domain-containing protein [Clostridium chromiireducens]
MEELTIALLIDSDNIGAKHIENILGELTKYGRVTIRRMYGDWTQERLKPWLEKSSQFSLTPIMQSNDTSRKNASDIGLVIDAMDILFSEKVNGFCIVSSDSDFNKLAKRLRESGNLVIGMGEQKTPESFRASCEKFIYLDIINEEIETEDEKLETAPKGSEISNKHFEEESFTKKSIIEKTIINMILDSNIDTMHLGEIGQRINNMFPDFDVRNYHYTKLSELLKEFDSLYLSNKENKYWVSIKSIMPENIKEIENKIIMIFNKKRVAKMNIGELKKELSNIIPNLDIVIKKSGVTKFSLFLDKKIDVIKISGYNAQLIK